MFQFDVPGCRPLSIAGAALVAYAALSGCSSSSSPAPAPPAANPFATVIFLGDSLTAGFQNGALLDTGQQSGFANLLATQAGFSITLPLIASPGVPACLELTNTGFPPGVRQVSGTSTGREDLAAQPTDLAVPGQTLHQLINLAPTLVPTTDEAFITDLVLGFPVGNTNPQLAEAVALKPSTIFLWVGANDALVADESGDPASMTSLSSFTADYTQMMATLKATGAHLVVANLPDVTALPYMTPAATILAEVAPLAGLTQAMAGVALGIQSGDLVNGHGLDDLEAELHAIPKGKALTPLSARDVLTAAEVATVQANIDSYNTVIQQQVTASGGTLVDLHSYFATLAAGVTINGYTATNAFLGGLFSLDGIHPTNTGYALLANQFIAATNSAFSLSTPAVNVTAVAASDPYFGPNIKPVGSTVRIPTLAARQAGHMIRGSKSR